MIDHSLLINSIILILVIPFLVIILGEWSARLQKIRHPFASVLHVIRNFFIPSLSVWLFLKNLLKIADNNWLLPIVSTVTALFLLYTLLLIFKAIFTPYQPEYKWQINIPNLLFQFLRALLVLAIFAYTLSQVWQVNLIQVIGALGIGSLVMALALQDTLSNLVSGFLLIIESPFQVGDWIKVGTIEGEVIEINWRAVRIRNLDHDIVIIPNGNLGKEIICNYSLLDRTHALRIPLRFSYQERPYQVEATLKAVALSIEGIVADPEPQIEPKYYGNTYIDYEIKVFITNFAKINQIEGDFLKRAYYALRRQNFQQPFADKIEYKIDELPQEIGRNPDDISQLLFSMPIFAQLERDALKTLAQGATIQEFGTGEEIVSEGEFDRGFYLVRSGQVVLFVKDFQGEKQEINRLGKGDFFGEMVLLSGETSRVSIVALVDTTVIEIAFSAIANVIQNQPKFALLLSQFIEERKKAIRLAKG
jgi:small-conductance mechanosensitive channel